MLALHHGVLGGVMIVMRKVKTLGTLRSMKVCADCGQPMPPVSYTRCTKCRNDRKRVNRSQRFHCRMCDINKIGNEPYCTRCKFLIKKHGAKKAREIRLAEL